MNTSRSLSVKNIYIFIYVSLILLNVSCGISGKLSHENYADEYSSIENILNPDIDIFHIDTALSEILVHIPEGDVLFVRDSNLFISRILVTYEIHDDYITKAITDSGSKYILTSSINNSKETEDTLLFKFSSGKKSIMQITIRDLNRNNEIKRVFEINKLTDSGRQNYLMLDSNSKLLYRNYILQDENFKFLSAGTINKKFYVRCYFKKYPIAIPPFKIADPKIFNYKSDSVFLIDQNAVAGLALNKYGFYHFQSDTSVKDGFTVYRYSSDFPRITNPKELVEPTRYLTSNSEFNTLISAKDIKAGIERFWLNIAGNEEKARDLIRIYYGRVERSNKLYSSYTEGWKTDRGLIYIIFGAPSTVYRDNESEYWNYTNQLYMPDITFTFKRMSNPFTDNDYNLIRDPVFERPYYLAVEQWRQGRVENDK